MQQILIIGTGGLAREFTEWCKGTYEIAGYYSNNPEQHTQFNLPGKFYSELVTPDMVGTNLAFIAIASCAAKQKMYQTFAAAGFSFPVFVHPTSVVAESAQLAEGVVIAPHCVISPNVILNKFVNVNYNCGVGHETIIGDFCQLNPGVQIGGGSNIAENVLVGSNATILHGITVGSCTTVASGAVVFASVAENITVMGNPARRMREFESA